MAQKVKFTNANGNAVVFGEQQPFKFGSIKGITETAFSEITSTAVNRDGEIYNKSEAGVKQIALTFILSTNTISEMMDARKEIIRLLNPNLGEGTLEYTANGEKLKIKCVADDIPDFKIEGYKTAYEYEVIFVAHFPYWFKDEKKVEFSTIEGGWNFPLGILQEGRDAGYRIVDVVKNVINDGGKECGVDIELTAFGSVKNPTIECIENKEKLMLNYTMKTGERIIIKTNFDEHEITSVINNNKSDIINNFVITSDFVKCPPGESTFRYDAESGVDNLSVVMSFKPLYLGA
ncbi:MAG: phage tail family protein [Eubacterium sp.]